MDAQATPPSSFAPVRALTSRLRSALPQGRTLPEADWRRRHHALLALLWLHVLGLPIFALTQGYSLLHSIGEGLPMAALAVLAILAGRNRRLSAACVSIGLITSSAVLVHLWGGVIEAHFHFFVMIVLLSLYEDWVPFLIAAAYVVLHHGITGVLDPASVYNHRDAVEHPWRWAAIHGLFVTGAGAGAVVAWRLNENVRLESARSYRKARESEERFKTAFDSAPIGMTLVGMGTGDAGRLHQVNRALCDMTGYGEDELLARTWDQLGEPGEPSPGGDLLARLGAGERGVQEEKRMRHADGSTMYALVGGSLVCDSAANPLYAIVQIQDVTDRHHAQQQLRYQAFHDPLTDLPNRRRLMVDLERDMTRASHERPVLLILFDLDGFKAYNDTFGHPAGDALLARLGRRLEGAVEGRGVGYRMGGDEFCVLSPVGVEGSEPIERAAAAALAERGEGFQITASHGSTLLPLEAADAAEALRVADARLYARKGTVRASAGRQAADALLRALSERSPDLGSHLDDVTDLCAAVANALGLPEEERAPLLQAAALHDVGKVAIPDAILDKPAPLDDSEWAFMKTHTLIGERILAAAPALTEASRLVRWTHERVDGMGYPDGLTGEEIPRGARIVAVCDAFDAMTSDRAYRRGISPEGALSELSRGAGTQFDPAVVDAFVNAVRGTRQKAAAGVRAPN